MKKSVENIEIISRTNYSDLMHLVVEKIKDLFELEEVEVTFPEDGKNNGYTFVKTNSRNNNPIKMNREREYNGNIFRNKGPERKYYCQGCGMPMDELNDFESEKNGYPCREYCRYCYHDGLFTDSYPERHGS